MPAKAGIRARVSGRRMMFYVTVKLYGRNGIRGEFFAYEQKALAIFKRHGGEVVVAYAPALDKSQKNKVGENDQADFPDEIQILKIADRAAFDRFVQDPERLGMVEERDAVIRKTEVYLSAEIIGY
jgi:hypothetical protein